MSLAVSSVDVDPGDWTAVVAPVDADTCVVSNAQGAGALALRIDSGDPTTELVIDVGTERALGGALHFERPKHTGGLQAPARFRRGYSVFYVKPTAGTGPIVFIWL